jgi:hypothetical protein
MLDYISSVLAVFMTFDRIQADHGVFFYFLVFRTNFISFFKQIQLNT